MQCWLWNFQDLNHFLKCFQKSICSEQKIIWKPIFISWTSCFSSWMQCWLSKLSSPNPPSDILYCNIWSICISFSLRFTNYWQIWICLFFCHPSLHHRYTVLQSLMFFFGIFLFFHFDKFDFTVLRLIFLSSPSYPVKHFPTFGPFVPSSGFFLTFVI